MARGWVDTLFRCWRGIAVATSLFTLAFGLAVYLWPAKYQSEMTFLVKNNRLDLIAAPDGSGTRTLEVSDAEIATEMQLLASRDIAAQVVDGSGLAGETPLTREKAILKLQKDLRIAPLLKSDMIQVRYASRDAAQSAKVLELLAATYLDRHVVLHGNTNSLEFFDKQTGETDGELKQAQEKMLEFRKRSGVSSAESEKNLYLQKLVELEVALRQAEAEAQDTAQRVAQLEPRVAAIPARIATQNRQVPNQYSVERMNTMLTELRNRKTELLTKFPPTDRMIVQIDQQIADTTKALAEADKRISTEQASDVNPLHQTLAGELERANTALAGLRARVETMRAQRQQYRAQLARMESLIPSEQNLSRDLKVAEDKYLLYTKKLEESRIGRQMDQQKIANVVLAEAPQTPILAESRLNGATIAGYIAGLFGSLFFAVFFSRSRHTVQTPWDLEGAVALPVLGTVPARSMRRVAPRQAQHRRAS